MHAAPRARVMIRPILFSVGLLSVALAAPPPLASPLYLDATTDATTQREGAVALRPGDAFDAARGYGWSRPPAGGFGETSWSGVRSPALCDGVSGRDFTLQVDLAPGRWTALVFLDDGYLDAHLVQLELNGRVMPHNPREFGLEEEPAKPPINRYRVAALAFDLRGPTTLRFSRDADHGVRLLAVHLLPAPAAGSDAARWFTRQLQEVGRHGSHASLDALRRELRTQAGEPAQTAFGTYWGTHLDLLDEAERWHRAAGWDWFSLQTRSSMFTRYKIAVSLLDPLVEHPEGAAFLLRDRALWLRARLLYWIWVEQHLPKDKAAFDRDIAELRQRHPGDSLIAMYAGEKIDLPDPWDNYAAPANAPAWSTAQFEALQRLRHVAHYWIDERQIPNGELGGKPDDDVETLRWWPTLMFSGDRKVTAAFGRLAEGVWFSRRIHRGYARDPRDVEHSAEFVADTVPMMAFVTRSEEWIARLAWSHEHMRNLWTGRNAHGDLQFKSAWFGATEIVSTPPRNRDVAMNARATKAVRWLAWLRHDRAATDLLHAWSTTWAKAALRSDKGKPAGLFPASLRWPDAAFNGDETSWHQANMFWHYFDWRADGMLYDELLCSWLRTRDESLLAPMHASIALMQTWAGRADRATAPAGSAGWAADQLLKSADFWGVVAQWRLETGDPRFDPFLKQHAPPYLRFRLGGGPQAMADGITRSMLEHLRYNTPMRTTEVLFTDRIHVARDIDNWDGTDLVVAMLTGNHVSNGMSPYYHVAWESAPATFTALVTAAGANALAADIFLHQPDAAPVTARCFRLTPGHYRLTLRAGDRVLLDRRETVGADHRATFTVPGAALVRIMLTSEASGSLP
jgi:hypothetical protein